MHRLLRTSAIFLSRQAHVNRYSNNLYNMSLGSVFQQQSCNNSTTKSANMADEYGKLDSSGETFVYKNFPLELGGTLPEAHVIHHFFNALFSQPLVTVLFIV